MSNLICIRQGKIPLKPNQSPRLQRPSKQSQRQKRLKFPPLVAAAWLQGWVPDKTPISSASQSHDATPQDSILHLSNRKQKV